MTITQVADAYNKGELSVSEAVRYQQQLCAHRNYAIDADGLKHCHDCGLAHQTCSLCVDDEFSDKGEI